MELPKTTQELAEIVKRNYECGLERGRQQGREEVVREEMEALRDQFAMAVLPEAYRAWITAGNGEKGVAAMAYNMADAMLEERNKRV